MAYILWVHWHCMSNTICLPEYFSTWVHSELPPDCSIYLNHVHQDVAHGKAWSLFLLTFPGSVYFSILRFFSDIFSYVFWLGFLIYRNIFDIDVIICFSLYLYFLLLFSLLPTWQCYTSASSGYINCVCLLSYSPFSFVTHSMDNIR